MVYKDKENSKIRFRKIIDRIRKQEKGGLEEFYELYGEMIKRKAMSILHRSDKADDVQDEILTKIWNISLHKPGKLYNVANPESWLCSAAKNCAINILRKKEFVPLSDFIPSERDYFHEFEDEDSFESRLKILSPTGQQIFKYRFGQEYRFDEIAEMMGRPLSTITSIYYRGIEKLRKREESLRKNED